MRRPVPAHVCANICVHECRGQKKGSDPVELKLQEVEPPGVGADSLEEQQRLLASEPSPQSTKFSSRIGSQLYSKGHS